MVSLLIFYKMYNVNSGSRRLFDRREVSAYELSIIRYFGFEFFLYCLYTYFRRKRVPFG